MESNTCAVEPEVQKSCNGGSLPPRGPCLLFSHCARLERRCHVHLWGLRFGETAAQVMVFILGNSLYGLMVMYLYNAFYICISMYIITSILTDFLDELLSFFLLTDSFTKIGFQSLRMALFLDCCISKFCK